MATFTFHNPGNSAYFTMETARHTASFYTSSVSNYASGSFDNFVGSNPDHMVNHNRIFAQVIPHGTSSFEFNNAITIPAGAVYFRGTGEYNLIVTV